MLRLFVLLLLLTTPILAQENAGSKHMTLFGWLNPVDSVGMHSAIWGYAAPDGREYAFVGSQIGTHIVDVSTSPISQVAFIPGPWNRWREMKTYGSYLYIVSESRDVPAGAGLQIVDLSELPARATLVRTDTTYFRSAHTVYVRDHWLYVMGTAEDAGANGGVLMFDLEPDPLHPRPVGRVDRDYYHDAWERGDTLVTAAVYGNGIDVYDVRDRAVPVFLTNINYPYSGTHNVEITSDGGYLVSSDEIGFTAKTMKVWDIRDLENVRMVAEYTHDPLDIVHNVHVMGRFVVASWYTGGVRIIDMIDPTHPREVAYYDTWPGQSGGYNGVWEVYPFLPSGRVLAGDRSTGLYVLDWERRTAGSVSGVVTDADNGLPLEGVEIFVPELGRRFRTGRDGRYYIGGAVGDAFTMQLERFGYGDVVESVTLSRDETLDIGMRAVLRHAAQIEVRDESGQPIEGFSFAVEPHIPAQLVASGNVAEVQLPAGEDFTLTVGKWGFRVVEMPVRLTQANSTIAVTLVRRYHDNATLDLGWTLGAPTDDATSGMWVRIEPYLGYPQSGWAHPARQPDGRLGRVFMTGAPPINAAPQENDVNGGTTSLISPTMDLSDHGDPVLQFDLWFIHYPNFSSDTTLAIDSLTVDASNDDGQTWYRIHSEARVRGGWAARRLPMRPFLPITDRMRVRFQLRDRDDPSLIFAAIDNIDVAPTQAQTAAPAMPGERTTMRVLVAPNPGPGGAEVLVDPVGPGALRVVLYDALGARVATLHDGHARGSLRLRLPEPLAPGTYLLRAESDAGDLSVPVSVVR